jgi:hypothetical protein
MAANKVGFGTIQTRLEAFSQYLVVVDKHEEEVALEEVGRCIDGQLHAGVEVQFVL